MYLKKNIWKRKIFSCQKGANAVKLRKVIFWKSQKLLTERALSELHGGSLFKKFNSYIHSISMAGIYIRKRRTGFCLLRTPSPRGKQFLWFLKIDLLRFHRIYLFYLSYVQIWFILMLWILVGDTLKKWWVSFDARCKLRWNDTMALLEMKSIWWDARTDTIKL